MKFYRIIDQNFEQQQKRSSLSNFESKFFVEKNGTLS